MKITGNYFVLVVVLIMTAQVGKTNASPQYFKHSDTLVVNQVKVIKNIFTKINTSLPSLKKTIKNLEPSQAGSTESGELVKYIDGTQIKKMIETSFGETGKFTEEYYFENGELLFYYATEERYNHPIYIDPRNVKTLSKTEIRYYFMNRKIIKYVCNPVKRISANEIINVNSALQKKSKK